MADSLKEAKDLKAYLRGLEPDPTDPIGSLFESGMGQGGPQGMATLRVVVERQSKRRYVVILLPCRTVLALSTDEKVANRVCKLMRDR